MATGVPCAPIRSLFADDDVDGAYAVQDRLTAAALSAGRRLIGRKIGLTSAAVQKQLGVDQPDYGMLFDVMDVPLGATIPWGRVCQPRIEAEIAFVLGDDLNGEGLTSKDVLAAVAYALPVLEIVGSRIAGWDIGIVDTIADNASSGLFVLGHTPRPLSAIDIVAARMTMCRGEKVVSTGSGLACLGSPLSATLWLARSRPLLRGDVMLSGALGPMVPAAPGDRFSATIEGIGSVSASFAEAP